MHDVVYADRRNINNNVYLAQKNMGFLNLFASSSSQLISINGNGDKTVIYDVNSSYFRDLLILFIVVVVLVGFAVIRVWLETKKFIKTRKND